MNADKDIARERERLALFNKQSPVIHVEIMRSMVVVSTAESSIGEWEEVLHLDEEDAREVASALTAAANDIFWTHINAKGAPK